MEATAYFSLSTDEKKLIFFIVNITPDFTLVNGSPFSPLSSQFHYCPICSSSVFLVADIAPRSSEKELLFKGVKERKREGGG